VIIAYARVSTDGQTLDAQQAALAAAGAERVFAEKVSGVVTDRRQLARAIAALGAGDVLLVTRLDRLARSTRDLLNVLDAIAQARRGVSIAGGCVVRYVERARQANDNDPWWACGVRAISHSCAHQ
jgi:DNA invertase Pin-like site-specific DNA recombinase